MPERYALYFAPAATSELWQRAAHWLGRDAATGTISNDGIPGISGAELTAATPSATRYGFHATLKAPMALAEGRSRAELEAALADFAAATPRFSLGRLTLRSLDGFIAVTQTPQHADLTEFAGKLVAAFEPFRAPMSAADRAKRLQSKLSPRQVELLDQYGYPYVMEQFLFHMTLSDRLAPEAFDKTFAAATNWLAPVIADEVILDRISLFVEPEPGAPFLRRTDFLLKETAA